MPEIDVFVYLIVFKDGAMKTAVKLPNPTHYQKGARFFRCAPETTITDLSDFAFFGFKAQTEELKQKIVRIKP